MGLHVLGVQTVMASCKRGTFASWQGTIVAFINQTIFFGLVRPRRCVRHGQTDATSEMRVQFRRRNSDASNEMHKLF